MKKVDISLFCTYWHLFLNKNVRILCMAKASHIFSTENDNVFEVNYEMLTNKVLIN